MSNNNCKKEYEQLLQNIRKNIDEIDNKTISDNEYNLEPHWWLSMMKLRRLVEEEIKSI